MGQEELEIAAQNYARLIKMQPRDHMYHFKLATVLEEMYYAQDMFGIKKEVFNLISMDWVFQNLFANFMNSFKLGGISKDFWDVFSYSDKKICNTYFSRNLHKRT